MMTQLSCPLCYTVDSQFYSRDRRREYRQCSQCMLVFVPSHQRLSPAAERAEYDQHNNCSEDLAYRRFLSRLVTPLQQCLPHSAEGLDFGCGPGPTLSLMMAESGWSMALFDPFYYNDLNVLDCRYDFITATEVVEHIFDPGKWLPQLWSMINPGGYLALMTKRVIDQEAFANWHYKNDPTHVCFFSEMTFEYLANLWSADIIFVDKDVVFFKKT